LKKELIYRISAYRLSMAEVKSLVFRNVFIYYNRIRVYTANPGGWARKPGEECTTDGSRERMAIWKANYPRTKVDIPVPASLDRTPGKCCG